MTERKEHEALAEAQRLLADSEARLRVTLASIGDAVIVTDGEGRVTFLNAVAEKLTGWAREDASGHHLAEVFRIVNEQTGEEVESPVGKVLREGTVVGLANHTVLVAKDGTRRPIDDSGAPIRDPHGIVGVVLVFRDVTERRRAEAVQRESERRFRTVIEQVKDYAIFTTDPYGRATSWNEGVRRVLGFEETEFVSQDVQAVFTPEDVRSGVPQQELEEAAAHGSASNDRWMRRKDGSQFFASGITSAQRDEAGKLVGFTKIMRDQTDRKQLEDELRQYAAQLSEADRRKSEFLAILAHELRNPLAPIQNALQVLRQSGANRDTGKAAMDMMDRQLGHMVRLIEDLLDVSRISRGKMELRKMRVELATIVNLGVESVRPLCQRMKQELTVTLPATPIYLDADPARLSQIVGNLLNNACKFTKEGGRIRLTIAWDEGGQVAIQVKDTGIGLTTEQLSRIFEMFMQVDSSLERSQGGLGIGLTLVKNLVEMHGGSVEAFSEGLGQGSTFTVRLPLAQATPESQQAGEQAHAFQSVGTRRRILVVDDNRDSAASLALLLQMTGHEVRTAHDGPSALEAAATFMPEVVLLDIGLPGMNGYEVARRMRAMPPLRETLLVAQTGWGQEEDRRRSMDAGFDAHLVKPVVLDALRPLLADHPKPLTGRDYHR